MDKIKNLMGLGLLLVVGCGAAEEGGYEDEELGQAEQAYHSRVSGLYQHGTQTGSAHRACDRGTTGQTCSVPAFKTIEICPSSTFTQAERNLLNPIIGGIDNRSNYSFSQPVCSNPPAANTVRMIIDPEVVSGTGSSNIQGYSDVILGSLNSLTEGVAGADPVGNFQKHGNCQGKIDRSDIYAKGANATEDNRLMRHAFASIILKCAGHGSRQDAAAVPAYSRETIVLGSDLTTFLTDGEKCRADAYDTTNNGDWSNTGAVCPTE